MVAGIFPCQAPHALTQALLGSRAGFCFSAPGHPKAANNASFEKSLILNLLQELSKPRGGVKPGWPGKVGAPVFPGMEQRHPETAQKCPEGHRESCPARAAKAAQGTLGKKSVFSIPFLLPLPLHFPALFSFLRQGPAGSWDAAARIPLPYHL